MFDEEELLPLSGLQHLHYCERQWGLIHLEQQWEESRLTAEGRLLHEHAHEAGTELRGGLLTTRGLHLHSFRLGLSGQADVVEFHRLERREDGAIELPDRTGWWRVFPVEYKRGKPKRDACDEVQLCAQAMCLEEGLGAAIRAGALFYGQNRRRFDVAFDEGLRRETEAVARRMHELFAAGRTPAAEYSKKCDRCSLYDRCLPRSISRRNAVARYAAKALSEAES
jgi:CRISPR-associated exonuclease Cas4